MIVLLILLNFLLASSATSTLELVHVIFRHGDRNPEASNLWPNNSYYSESFYPEGYGQLINKGKVRDFKLGRFLRRRYDDFLGDKWHINILDVRSTDTNRTKMSAALVLSGLWPPRGKNIWNIYLPWQPIPFNTVPIPQDTVLSPWFCNAYFPELNNVLNSPEISNYITERYGETIEILNNNTGVNSTFGIFGSIYYGLSMQEQLGFPLDNWTAQIYPEQLRSLAVDFYYITTNTTTLRKLLAGFFLQKILSDTQNLINGTLSPSDRRMFLYSAHELNVAGVVLSLTIYKLIDIAGFDSHVIFEVHKINGVYGIKVFYGESPTSVLHGPLIMPGCSEFCPFDQFYSLVEGILPSSDAVCYES